MTNGLAVAVIADELALSSSHKNISAYECRIRFPGRFRLGPFSGPISQHMLNYYSVPDLWCARGDYRQCNQDLYCSKNYAGVILDKLGNLYGTTMDGGRLGQGAVFEVSP
jgi:hypothetical protein